MGTAVSKQRGNPPTTLASLAQHPAVYRFCGDKRLAADDPFWRDDLAQFHFLVPPTYAADADVIRLFRPLLSAFLENNSTTGHFAQIVHLIRCRSMSMLETSQPSAVVCRSLYAPLVVSRIILQYCLETSDPDTLDGPFNRLFASEGSGNDGRDGNRSSTTVSDYLDEYVHLLTQIITETDQLNRHTYPVLVETCRALVVLLGGSAVFQLIDLRAADPLHAAIRNGSDPTRCFVDGQASVRSPFIVKRLLEVFAAQKASYPGYVDSDFTADASKAKLLPSAMQNLNNSNNTGITETTESNIEAGGVELKPSQTSMSTSLFGGLWSAVTSTSESVLTSVIPNAINMLLTPSDEPYADGMRPPPVDDALLSKLAAKLTLLLAVLHSDDENICRATLFNVGDVLSGRSADATRNLFPTLAVKSKMTSDGHVVVKMRLDDLVNAFSVTITQLAVSYVDSKADDGGYADESALLLLYAVLYRNENVRALIQLSSVDGTTDDLVLALLSIAHCSEAPRQSVYVALTCLLVLFEDTAFCRCLSTQSRVSRLSLMRLWPECDDQFMLASANQPCSSLAFITLIRLTSDNIRRLEMTSSSVKVDHNVIDSPNANGYDILNVMILPYSELLAEFEVDPYIHSNCLALLTNLSYGLSHLTSAVAQRAISTVSHLSKRLNKIDELIDHRQRHGFTGVGVGTIAPDDIGAQRRHVKKIVADRRLSNDLLRSIILSLRATLAVLRESEEDEEHSADGKEKNKTKRKTSQEEELITASCIESNVSLVYALMHQRPVVGRLYEELKKRLSTRRAQLAAMKKLRHPASTPAALDAHANEMIDDCRALDAAKHLVDVANWFSERVEAAADAQTQSSRAIVDMIRDRATEFAKVTNEGFWRAERNRQKESIKMPRLNPAKFEFTEEDPEFLRTCCLRLVVTPPSTLYWTPARLSDAKEARETAKAYYNSISGNESNNSTTRMKQPNVKIRGKGEEEKEVDLDAVDVGPSKFELPEEGKKVVTTIESPSRLIDDCEVVDEDDDDFVKL